MESAHPFVLVGLRYLLHLQAATGPGGCLGIVAKRASVAAGAGNERDVHEEEPAGVQKRVLDVRTATPGLAPKEDSFGFRGIPPHSEFEESSESESGQVEVQPSGNGVVHEPPDVVLGQLEQLEVEQVHARVVFWGNPSKLELETWPPAVIRPSWVW